MNQEAFKKSMGLLGIGECQFLCDRIFKLITPHQFFDSDQFLDFLNTITFGSRLKKVKLSFDFLDRNSKGYIDQDDIEVIISEISFIWNFLTGEKVSNEQSIKLICDRLGISEDKSISFKEYLQGYDNEISWYDYFNSIKTNQSTKKAFNIDQVEEYLKLLHSEVENMILDLRDHDEDEENDQMFSELSQIKSTKGPIHVSAEGFKPKGDFDYYRDSLIIHRASALSREIMVEGSSKIEIVTNKLQKVCNISKKLFHHESNRENQAFYGSPTKKKAVMNITEPEMNRQNIVYFGHENWNLMLNMMLGIRKALKSHFYIYDKQVKFNEEDLNCKYAHELIYRKNNKSVKAICEIFVDYTPKVFSYIRRYFKIENHQFIKSVGLENLIGNLLMGNLSSLTDQTSEGKSGSFIYYTEDLKLIIKSIPKEEYQKLRDILNDYAEYVRSNPETFLVHIYGLYKLKNKQTNRQIYFIVINNFFSAPLEIQERYDIKGAITASRETKKQHYTQNVILKDVDLINNHSRSFRIDQDVKITIYKQIVKDIEFLKSHNIIEYSLLVGIHKRESLDEPLISSPSIKYFLSTDKAQVFFFGLIDVLSDYSAKKALGTFIHFFNSDISFLSPEQYATRFQNFIYKYIFSS